MKEINFSKEEILKLYESQIGEYNKAKKSYLINNKSIVNDLFVSMKETEAKREELPNTELSTMYLITFGMEEIRETNKSNMSGFIEIDDTCFILINNINVHVVRVTKYKEHISLLELIALDTQPLMQARVMSMF